MISFSHGWQYSVKRAILGWWRPWHHQSTCVPSISLLIDDRKQGHIYRWMTSGLIGLIANHEKNLLFIAVVSYIIFKKYKIFSWCLNNETFWWQIMRRNSATQSVKMHKSTPTWQTHSEKNIRECAGAGIKPTTFRMQDRCLYH